MDAIEWLELLISLVMGVASVCGMAAAIGCFTGLFRPGRWLLGCGAGVAVSLLIGGIYHVLTPGSIWSHLAEELQLL